MQFQYRQIIHALPQHWKETIKHFARNLNYLHIQDHYLMKCNMIYNLTAGTLSYATVTEI